MALIVLGNAIVEGYNAADALVYKSTLFSLGQYGTSLNVFSLYPPTPVSMPPLKVYD